MFSDDDRQTVRREALRVFVRRHPRVAHWYLFGRAYLVGVLFVGVIVGASMVWAALPYGVHVFADEHPHTIAACTWITAGTIFAALLWFHIGGMARRLRSQGRGTRGLTRYTLFAVILLAVAGWVVWS